MSQKTVYLSTLVSDAKNGDSNSFAIIFVTTYEEIYKKAYTVLTNEYDIQDVMFKTYVTAFYRLKEVNRPENLQKWINTIFESHLVIQLKKYSISPKYYYRKQLSLFKRRPKKTMSIETAEQLLESVFMYVDAEPNSIPLEALKSYDSYRNSRTYLQRFMLLLVIAMILFVPFYMMEPRMSISYNPERTTSNQVHYTVNVMSAFPVSTVLGTVNGEDVTVMIEGDKIYDVRVPNNGTLTVKATIINNKSVTQTIEVNELDKIAPWVETYSLIDGNLEIVTRDDGGSGIDNEKCYVVRLSDGTNHPPISYDPFTGTMVLPHFPNDCGLILTDRSGNETSYTITFQ